MLCLFLIRNVACHCLEREKQKRSRLGPWLGRSETLKTNGNQRLSCKRKGEKTTSFPAEGWLRSTLLPFGGTSSVHGSSATSLFMPFSPHDVAVVTLLRFTTTSSYCFCVSNPSVMLLLSSNLGNTTAM